MQTEEQRNLAIITEMIQTARNQFTERGTIYLLWGWLVVIASIGQYIMIQYDIPYNSIVWLLMPIGAIAQIFIMKKEKTHVKTYIDKTVGRVWTAVGISIGLAILLTSDMDQLFSKLLILYAIGTYITGRTLNLKPLTIGAISCWCIAIACNFTPYENQLLLLATAMLVAYIIPGYVMNARYKSMNATNV